MMAKNKKEEPALGWKKYTSVEVEALEVKKVPAKAYKEAEKIKRK